MKTSITVIFTCFNRREKTIRCLETIDDARLDIQYIITDDSSNDGTAEAIKDFAEKHARKALILNGTGKLYWAGGMRKAMGAYLAGRIDNIAATDYVALVNDDVEFYPDALLYMTERSKKLNDAVIVGATDGSNGKLSYGAMTYRKGTVKCDLIPLAIADTQPCDTFSCNCTIFTDKVFKALGNFDEHYTHSMADYDYGFRVKRMGIAAYETDRSIGRCDDNPKTGSWRDTSLSRRERLRKKESPKGLPNREWFYYLRNNFGLGKAIWHGVTPYIKILVGR